MSLRTKTPNTKTNRFSLFDSKKAKIITINLHFLFQSTEVPKRQFLRLQQFAVFSRRRHLDIIDVHSVLLRKVLTCYIFLVFREKHYIVE